VTWHQVGRGCPAIQARYETLASRGQYGLEHGDVETKSAYVESRITPVAGNGSNPRDCDDKCDQGGSKLNLRQLELVWSPWAGPGTCEVDIDSKGVVAAKVRHR
jgi:hypothetical protein